MRSVHLPALCVIVFFALSALCSSDLRVSGQETVSIAQTPLPVRDSEMNQATGRSQDIQEFGGPWSVSGQSTEDSEIRNPEFRCQRQLRRMEPQFDFKRRLDESCALQFSIDESSFHQAVTSSLSETDDAGGFVCVYGQWTLAGQKSGKLGQLVFKGENRHRMGSPITPFDLGFKAGSILPTGAFVNEFNYGITNLYWKQYLCDRDLIVAIGKIHVTDFIDAYALMNPLMHFINLGFSTNPTIAVPNQGWGVAAAAILTNRIYLQVGVADANGQSTLAGFYSLIREHEYFSDAQISLTSSGDRIYLDNLHAMLWHTAARAEAQTPEGLGFAVTA